MGTEIKQPLTVRKAIDSAVVHFAGDSGDGMQISGAQLSLVCAQTGNAVQTYPDFPAEIRAPAGTIAGVSGFQCRFSDHDIHTPGDEYDVLVAMNPAAMVGALSKLKTGGILIIDEDKFTDKDFKKAKLTASPLTDEHLQRYQVHQVPMTHLTLSAIEHLDLSRAQARKCKNFFALGLVYWLYDRKLSMTEQWLEKKFSKKENIAQANIAALNAGYQYAHAQELFQTHYQVQPASLPPGEYRYMSGNQSMAWGCVAAATLSNRDVFFSGYPITPASDVLHSVAQYRAYGVMTFQAEDEICAIGAAIGAAYGGAIGVTCTSGPGLDLKMEALGLAVMTELPLVLIDVQRAGPSTGMPTKTEQSDLSAALHGRHGECPVPILAPKSPGDCFYTFLEACQIAIQYMTPVIILSDGYLANGSEPWRAPSMDDLPKLLKAQSIDVAAYQPYSRDEHLGRPWVTPGTPDLMHRIGGIEKAQGTGHISYDAENHQKMVDTRQEKIARIQAQLPLQVVQGPSSGSVLAIGWGSVSGALQTAVAALQSQHYSVSAVHLKHVYPLPKNLKDIMSHFDKVVIVELNLGQLAREIRAEFLVDALSLTKVTGQPFGVDELIERLGEVLS